MQAPIILTTALLLLAGCATRPINAPITQADPSTGYRYEVRQSQAKQFSTRRGGDDHHGFTGISTIAEGCRGGIVAEPAGAGPPTPGRVAH
jgi:hypothetical protein